MSNTLSSKARSDFYHNPELKKNLYNRETQNYRSVMKPKLKNDKIKVGKTNRQKTLQNRLTVKSLYQKARNKSKACAGRKFITATGVLYSKPSI